MQRVVGVVAVLLVALWLVAPAQTEALVKSAVELISHRISQSDPGTGSGPKGHPPAGLGQVSWPHVATSSVLVARSRF